MTEDLIGNLDTDSRCVMCDAAPHPRCETHTYISMMDPAKVPLGESDDEHLIDVPLCLEHFQAFENFANGGLTENTEVSD